jgi:FkbM family methyltransferase
MEEFRLQYPLTKDALVLDAGAFRGDFIDWCRRRWNCSVFAFEPCSQFANGIKKRFFSDSAVHLFRYGLAGKTEHLQLFIRGDSTSVFSPEDPPDEERVLLRDVALVFDELQLRNVDLFKINIEGGEYSLLDRMIESSLVERVRYFQIQFHGIGAPDPGAARDKIRAALSRTHTEEWCVNGGQWESWARKS